MRYFVVRALRALFTLWLVVTAVFVVLRLAGDPAIALAGPDADPDLVAYYAAKWALDRPIPEQYLLFVARMIEGDLGRSFVNARDALEVVLERVPRTLLLGGTGLALSLVVGLPLGVLAALRRGSWIDRLTMTFAVVGFSLPNFFLGILLILMFSLHLRWLPSHGDQSMWHLIMPALTLGLSATGSIARYTRSAMLDVLSQSYLRTAKAKGNPLTRRMRAHALPNAMIPIVTITGLRIGDVIAGAVVVESVFAWNGVGRLLIQAVVSRDLAVVQAIVLLIATTMVLANLTVDYLYGWLDPRLRRRPAVVGGG